MSFKSSCRMLHREWRRFTIAVDKLHTFTNIQSTVRLIENRREFEYPSKEEFERILERMKDAEARKRELEVEASNLKLGYTINWVG